jgi:hypothetical protein
MDSRLNLEAEPRVKRTASDDPPKASHPFFWAGYMLVDCGDRVEQKRDQPTLMPKKAAKFLPPRPADENLIQKPGKRRPQ